MSLIPFESLPWKRCLLSFLVLLSSLPAAAQTFTGSLDAENGIDFYQFMAAAGGQYEATLSWDDDAALMTIILACDDGGEGAIYGVSAGNRDRISRLSVGLHGPKECVMLAGLAEGTAPTADYTLNFQGTTLVDFSRKAKAAIPPALLAELVDAFYDAEALYREARPVSSEGFKALGPTRSFLAQIQGGAPQSFQFEVGQPGLVQITAMWNRQDTDLRLTMVCEAGTETAEWGISESRQERVLRFDADVLPGTVCEVALSSPNTMVYALNFAFLTDAGLESFDPFGTT